MARYRVYTSALLLVVVLLAPRPLTAQQGAAVDSLRAELRALQARIDSLVQVLRSIQQEEERKRAQAELERLRAAAAAAAEAGGGAEQTEGEPSFVGRERSQQSLNPEISVAGDLVGFARASPRETAVIPRELEFAFQAAIDPFARTRIFITHEQELPLDPSATAEGEEGTVEIEEAVVYWVGLPGGTGLDVGKFRMSVGVLNRWHTHALPEVDRPLALRDILGNEGLIQTGGSIYWLAPFSGSTAYEFWFQLTASQNEVLLPEASTPTFLTHFNVFRDIGSASYVQLGATGLYADDENTDLRARLAGFDFTYNWRPPTRALRREFTFRTEWLWADQRLDAVTRIARGGYAAGYYRLGRRWNAGLRFDLLDPFEGAQDVWQTAATITYSQSEFLRIRGQWNHLDVAGGSDDLFLLQLVWLIGPHREELY